MLVPLALYLAWYAAHGVSRASPDELAAGVLWAGEAAFYAAGALIGERGIQPGRVMFIPSWSRSSGARAGSTGPAACGCSRWRSCC